MYWLAAPSHPFLASLRRCKARRVVAVVGMGHVRGIQKHWNDNINMRELVTVPNQPSLLAWAFKRVLLLLCLVAGPLYIWRRFF